MAVPIYPIEEHSDPTVNGKELDCSSVRVGALGYNEDLIGV